MDFLVIVDLFSLLFLGLADNQVLPALFPLIGASLHQTVQTVGLLVVFYSLAAALASFFVGSLSDRYGRRPFLRGGALLFALASAAAAGVSSFTGLAAARALTGLAAGSLSTCAIAFAGDWFIYRVRGKAMGWISTAYFAAPLAVPLAGLMADRAGWRRVFLGFTVLGALTAAASLTLPEDRVAAHSTPQKLGETWRIFRAFLARRDTSAMLGIAFLVSGGLVSFLTYLGAWLQRSFGLSTTAIGLVFALGGGLAVISSPAGGALSDRFGKRWVSISSNVFLAPALLLVPLLPWGAGLLAAVGAVGVGVAVRQGPITALVTEMVPANERGSFVALRNICSQLGIGAAVFIGGFLYERHGYLAVTSLCAGMTALVAILLATHIAEPQAAGG